MKVVFSNQAIPSNGIASITVPIPKTDYVQYTYFKKNKTNGTLERFAKRKQPTAPRN